MPTFFFKWLYYFMFSQTVCQSLSSFTLSPKLGLEESFQLSHCKSYAVLFLCGFSLRFPNVWWYCYLPSVLSSFAYLKNWVVFSLWSFESSLYVLNSSPSGKLFANTLSLVVACLFIFLITSLKEHKFLILMKSNLTIF